jgi:hypothetical protein
MTLDLNDVQDVNEVNNSFNACEEHAKKKRSFKDEKFKH